MARLTKLDKAIAALDAEIAVLVAAKARLEAQRPVKVAVGPLAIREEA